MNKAKKLMIGGMAAVMGIVAATAATSGVAWFTTTRTANVTLTEFVATAAEGNLLVSAGAGAEVGVTTTIAEGGHAATVAVPEGGKSLANVSSANGTSFVYVSVDDTDPENPVYIGYSETTSTNSINNNLLNYYQWDLTIKNEGSNPMDVYISFNGDIFTDGDTTDEYTPEDWYRMTIHNGSNLVFAYGQDASTAACTNTGEITEAQAQGTGTAFVHATTLTRVTDNVAGAAVATASSQLLVDNLAAGISASDGVTLTFTVWCEGILTKADGTDLAVAGAFDLVGITQSA